MHWRLTHEDERKRMAILVSKPDHCLLDLLWRWRRGELEADIVLVASNHPDHADDVARLRRALPPRAGDQGDQGASEAALLELLVGQVDVVVLARYMQIISGDFLAQVGVPLINIHHSFLPAFVGADPYGQAHRKGVKVIGATAHYVTEDLDQGPIIDQGVERVSHRETPEELARIGGDIERTVLARAVKLHLEDRVLLDGMRTIVF